MTRINAALATAALLLLPGAAAEAGTITETVDFVASGTGGPQDPVTGSFTITYDPTLHYWNETGPDIVLNNLNIALDSPLSFTYDPGSYLQVGGLAGWAIGLTYGANDFVLSLFPGFFNSIAYSQVGETGAFYSSDITATYTPVGVATTPIPASLLLLLTALAGLSGVAFLRRGRMLRFAAAGAG
jgi:hypothetical protein